MHISMVRIKNKNKINKIDMKIFYLDKWIARQMEIHPNKKPVLLVAGSILLD